MSKSRFLVLYTVFNLMLGYMHNVTEHVLHACPHHVPVPPPH